MSTLPIPDIFLADREKVYKNGEWNYGPSPGDVLSVYLKGGPQYALDGHIFPFEPPMALLVPKNVVDQDLQKGNVDGFFVLFDSHGYVQKSEHPGGAKIKLTSEKFMNISMSKALSLEDANILGGLIQQIIAIGTGDEFNNMQRAGLVLQALSYYCKVGTRSDKNTTKTIDTQVVTFKSLIEEKAFSSISFSDLYRHYPYSTVYLEQQFVKRFGTTPVKFRTKLRLARAQELLIKKQLKIKEVARSVGYSDPLYFSREFKRQVGIAPSDFSAKFIYRMHK